MKITDQHFEDKLSEVISYIKGNMIRESDIDIDRQTPLISSGLIDSLSLVEFVMQLESIFGTKIPLMKMEAENFETLDILKEKLKIL